ncbi:MAG: hypothetical protein V2I48_08190 [Xanthomonadales bacterium]|jgi:glycosyltransferase involved in cell wall biosynthesis|nr:hypothetical protein [Xanthomonadales bacterium]
MSLFDWNNGFFLLLNANPAVFYMKDWFLRRLGKEQWLTLQMLSKQEAHLLVQISWDHEPEYRARAMAKSAARYLARHRKHRITFLANTPDEQASLQATGLDAVYCNGSVFLSESVHCPVPGSEKDFNAVYDAVVSPYKRHELAVDVKKLALITYRKGDSTDRYIHATVKGLKDAAWLNGSPDKPTVWINDRQVNQAINRARVGLALSAEEGFMYGSAQCLLAGLPVVSTHSVGGRDIFYDPAYTRIVADDPAAVAAAVEDFCAHPPPAELIRGGTLKRFAPHRERFMQLMRGITAGSESEDVWQGALPRSRPNKWRGTAFTVRENLSALRKPGQAAPWVKAGRRLQDAGT